MLVLPSMDADGAQGVSAQARCFLTTQPLSRRAIAIPCIYCMIVLLFGLNGRVSFRVQNLKKGKEGQRTTKKDKENWFTV